MAVALSQVCDTSGGGNREGHLEMRLGTGDNGKGEMTSGQNS